MLATIIPYFLLANVSDNTISPNYVPEFKFDSDVKIRVNWINNVTGIKSETGYNLTNKCACRPKTDTSLQCHFNYETLMVLEMNETGETKSAKEIDMKKSIEPFYFEIEFDKIGVNKIILEKNMSYQETYVDIAKAVASALNVATDLNKVKLSANPVELGQAQNIALGKCLGNVTANLKPISEEDSSNIADWKLELTPPLEKISGRVLNVMKSWNLTDCQTDNKYSWMRLFVIIFAQVNQLKIDDILPKMLKINDTIAVSEKSFNYTSVIDMELSRSAREIQVAGTTLKVQLVKRTLDVREISALRFIGIEPALNTWPEIKNPVTLFLNK